MNQCKKCGRIIGEKKHKCPENYNLLGKTFNYLTVIKRIGVDRYRHVLWKVRCVCGKEFNVLGQNIKYEHTKSCGCKYVEIRGEVHGQKRPKGVSNMKSIFYLYKRNAKNRNIEFNLSLKQFENITSKNCYYCNSQPSNEYKGHLQSNGSFVYNGIDRIDNNKGYFLENCVPCCHDCNWMKRDLSVETFKSHIEKIYMFMRDK